MKEIPFTQYLRPNGRQKPVTVERPQLIMDKAEELIGAGYVFEIEELMTGVVSMTCESKDEDKLDEEGAIGHELCPNGPGIPDAVDKLVTTAYTHWKGGNGNDLG